MTDSRDLRSPTRVACLGTYVPRRCGIATFSHDLCTAISQELGADGGCQIIAMNDPASDHDYPPCVRFEVQQEDPTSYRQASYFLNHRRIDLLLVQHEYGIYGGPDGEHLLTLMRNVRMPVVTIMHTVLRQPTPHLRQVTEELIRLSDRIVVMSSRGVEILRELYQAPPTKIAMIPHGIPDMAFVDPNFYKDQFGVEGRRVLLTFGLLSPGKGIENAIRAVAQLVPRHPDLVYIVLGATHPKVKEEYGEEYRHSLESLAEDLGILDNVMFVDRYVELDELCEYLGTADIYLTPYLGQEQITSGTLAYAMGSGKAVVSTPYAYAQEMLDEERGVLVPFADPEAMAQAIGDLLENEPRRQAIRKRAYMFTRNMVWRQVARSYLSLFDELQREFAAGRKRTIRRTTEGIGLRHAVPDLKLGHLRTLTDDTGILQHAKYTVPQRAHGYCTDDNGRALAFVVQAHRLAASAELVDLAEVYLSFLQDAFNLEAGRFRTFMAYDRHWLDEIGSEDCHARALWGLASCATLAPTEGLRAAAIELFERGVPATLQFTAPRAWADTLIALETYLERYGGDSEARRVRAELGDKLYDAFQPNISDSWLWFENTLTYGNGRLPHALLATGPALQRNELTEMGLRVLDWLLQIQTRADGVFVPVGNQGWYERGGTKARFDQQPIEAHAMLEASLAAHRVTGEERWIKSSRRCFNWFLGKNEVGEVVHDYQTGGCRDGLHAAGANQNEGAESTLVWLLSLLAMRSAQPADREVPAPAESPQPHSTSNGGTPAIGLSSGFFQGL